MSNSFSSSSEYLVKVFFSSVCALKLSFLYLSMMSSTAASAVSSSNRPGGNAFLTKRDIESASIDPLLFFISSWSFPKILPLQIKSFAAVSSTIRRIDSSWPSRSEPNTATEPAPRSIVPFSSSRRSKSSLPLTLSLSSSSKESSSIVKPISPSSPSSPSSPLKSIIGTLESSESENPSSECVSEILPVGKLPHDWSSSSWSNSE
mmetsp:Transcript_7289/g.22701  ORF Transcript_7289/g.22701 Transcript_7289/m.22701 type:complete len:205 (+) Transcript_7289:3478-4092(+)